MLHEDREVALQDAQLDGHATLSKTFLPALCFYPPDSSSLADTQSKIRHVTSPFL
jgi:hypothetical protein